MFKVIIMTVGFTMYFLPTIIAIARDKKNAFTIGIINLLLGWSGIGWIGALVLSVIKD